MLQTPAGPGPVALAGVREGRAAPRWPQATLTLPRISSLPELSPPPPTSLILALLSSMARGVIDPFLSRGQGAVSGVCGSTVSRVSGAGTSRACAQASGQTEARRRSPVGARVMPVVPRGAAGVIRREPSRS